MKNAGKARSYGLYRHLRTSKEIIENLLNYCPKIKKYIEGFEEDFSTQQYFLYEENLKWRKSL